MARCCRCCSNSASRAEFHAYDADNSATLDSAELVRFIDQHAELWAMLR